MRTLHACLVLLRVFRAFCAVFFSFWYNCTKNKQNAIKHKNLNKNLCMSFFFTNFATYYKNKSLWEDQQKHSRQRRRPKKRRQRPQQKQPKKKRQLLTNRQHQNRHQNRQTSRTSRVKPARIAHAESAKNITVLMACVVLCVRSCNEHVNKRARVVNSNCAAL